MTGTHISIVAARVMHTSTVVTVITLVDVITPLSVLLGKLDTHSLQAVGSSEAAWTRVTAEAWRQVGAPNSDVTRAGQVTLRRGGVTSGHGGKLLHYKRSRVVREQTQA